MGCLLKIGVIGINHKIADLTFRESIARAAAGLSGEKALFFPHPTVLLSTCNRTEIYFGGDDLAAAHSDLLNYLRKQIDEAFEHRLYSYFGIDCFAHLSRVTAGLDSAIVGETEIQRQVKIAYARGANLTSCMHYVFQKSLKLSKFVRNQFQIDRSAPTLCQAIWHLATEYLDDLLQQRILLVGHSDLNRSMAFFLMKKGVQNFSLCTKKPDAVHLAGCTPCDRSELQRWNEYDLIICAASSDRYLISGRSDRAHVIFDLSVPRNVDPQVASLTTLLYNIEEVNGWMERKRALQTDQLTFCDDLIWRQTLLLSRIYRQKTLALVNL
jgi:glutamyl-tRNA reductase